MTSKSSSKDSAKTTEQSVIKKDVKPLMFLRRHGRYNRGEIAGFSTKDAQDLIDSGVADTPEKASKVLKAESVGSSEE